MVPISPDQGAFTDHWIHPAVIINTLRATRKGASPWVPNRIPIYGSTQHFHGAVESDDSLMVVDTTHAVMYSGAIHI